MVHQTTERLKRNNHTYSGKWKFYLKASDGARFGKAVIHVRIFTIESSHGATDRRVKN